MTPWIQAAALTAAVVAFYLLTWFWWGRDSKPGTIVTLYEPARGLSPALMRYVWKERFDERVVWSGLLSLVSQGLAVLEKKEDATYIKPVWPPKRKLALPDEEQALYDDLASAKGHKGVRLSLADEWMAHMAARMAATLRVTQQGRWFVENRSVVLAGSVLSGVSIVIAAAPTSLEQVAALASPAGLIAVGAFYGYFLVQRIWELIRVGREHANFPVLRRLVVMILLSIPSAAAVYLGSVILYGNFGMRPLVMAAALTFVNLLFLYLMKAPTKQGRKLLDEIEGFRHFLGMVEHLPLDWPDAPSSRPGLYEKYLPYALALEVEQQWCDQMAAIASSDHEIAELGEGVHVFNVGMWDGRPVEIAYVPKVR